MVLPRTAPATAAFVVMLSALCATGAAGQTPTSDVLPRGDAGAYVGMFGANKSELDGFDDWYKRTWYGGLSAGYYWTEHLKTEIDLSATSRGEIYETPRPVGPGTSVFTGPIEHDFTTRRVAVGQHYQFFHNAWFHPTVGGGVAFTWETTERTIPAVFAHDRPGPDGRFPQPRLVAPERREGPETHHRAMAFAATGFKAYVGRRGFFRSDLQVAFADRVEDVTVRLGFGVDF
jgi:Outer membrane protein beta-barrel domain